MGQVSAVRITQSSSNSLSGELICRNDHFDPLRSLCRRCNVLRFGPLCANQNNLKWGLIGSLTQALAELKADIGWIQMGPTSIIDDGIEGYLSQRLQPDGRRVCTDDYPINAVFENTIVVILFYVN